MLFRLLLMLLYIYIAVFIALTFFISTDYLGYTYIGITLLFIFDLYNFRGRIGNFRIFFTLALIVVFSVLAYNAFN